MAQLWILTCVLFFRYFTGVSGMRNQSDDVTMDSLLLVTAGCLVLLVSLLMFCVFFKRRSFDIVQADFATNTSPFYNYHSQLQKESFQSPSPKPTLDHRVSVISLIPPDEVTASVSHDKSRHHPSSSLDVIAEEQYTFNGTASGMVELDGGFSVLAVPSGEGVTYTDEDYTSISKVQRTAPPPQVTPVTLGLENHRESVLSIDESDRPEVPPKTPDSRVLLY